MAIERIDFENLSEVDLQELVDAQVPEGLRIEYKRDLYGNSDAEKRECLKDISAFANAHGGHLLIGIETQNGLPTAVRGISRLAADEVILRLEQLIRSGLEPRVLNVRIRAVRLADGAHVFVVRVPQSWNLPHRVSAQNSNRFWIRNSGGVHEASMNELRDLFTFTSNVLDRVRTFRDDRVQTLMRGTGPRPLQGGGRFIVHLVPLTAFASRSQVDLQMVYQNHQLFRPIGTMGMTPRFNFDGFINERGGDLNHGYTQVFRNGTIEATKANIVSLGDQRRVIPGLGLEEQFFEVLSGYLSGLRNVGVSPPIVLMITLEGVEGANYSVYRNRFGDPEPVIDRAVLSLPECVVDDYGTDVDYHRAARPAFDALWNAVGYSSAQFFDQTGLWVGNKTGR
jgi:Putative DNA-binding domain